MELKKAIKILQDHQKWRLGVGDMHSPKEITQAIDTCIAAAKRALNYDKEIDKILKTQ